MNENKYFDYEDELDFKKIALIFWNKKLMIFSITSIFMVLSIVYTLLIPNIYSSSALLAPTSHDESLSSKLGAYSSLAGMTGIRLSDENASKSDEALERIQSFEFFSKYFLPNIKLQNMLAVKKWDAQKNKIIYKDSVFDEKNEEWVRKVQFPLNVVPSNQEAFKTYKEILSLNVDNQKSFVRISIKHQSPVIAKNWLDIIIFNINESMRLKDIEIAESNINFLNESQESTNIQSLKEVATSLLESQMQTLMLASSNKAYVYEIIDSPIVPEIKSGPMRLTIVFFSTIIGAFFSMLVAYLLHIRESE